MPPCARSAAAPPIFNKWDHSKMERKKKHMSFFIFRISKMSAIIETGCSSWSMDSLGSIRSIKPILFNESMALLVRREKRKTRCAHLKSKFNLIDLLAKNTDFESSNVQRDFLTCNNKWELLSIVDIIVDRVFRISVCCRRQMTHYRECREIKLRKIKLDVTGVRVRACVSLS